MPPTFFYYPIVRLVHRIVFLIAISGTGETEKKNLLLLQKLMTFLKNYIEVLLIFTALVVNGLIKMIL